MARKKAGAKAGAKAVEKVEPPSRRPMRTPPWRAMFLRRVAVHGSRQRAALESDIGLRRVEKVIQTSPRFARAVRIAQKMALEAHAERMQETMLTVAEKGEEVPVYYLGQKIDTYRKLIPGLTRLVAEITVPMFAEARRERLTANSRAHAGSPAILSTTNNTLNISLGSADLEDPAVRAALLTLSEHATRSRQAIDVTPPPAIEADGVEDEGEDD